MVDLCSLSYSIGTIVTFCYVCVCEGHSLYVFWGWPSFCTPQCPPLQSLSDCEGAWGFFFGERLGFGGKIWDGILHDSHQFSPRAPLKLADCRLIVTAMRWSPYFTDGQTVFKSFSPCHSADSIVPRRTFAVFVRASFRLLAFFFGHQLFHVEHYRS